MRRVNPPARALTIAGKINGLATGAALLVAAGSTGFIAFLDYGYPQAGPQGLPEPGQVMPTYLLVAGLLVLVSAAGSFLLSRRITAPLSKLQARAANTVAARRNGSAADSDAGELSAIAQLLTEAARISDSAPGRDEAEYQRLSADWQERTAVLSQTNEELSISIREVTEARDRLWKLAYYDSLTSLPNRRLFIDHLDRVLNLAQRKGEQVAVLFLDLDNFKQINDSFGHAFGDLLLQEVAGRLQGCVRDSDVVSYQAGPGSRADISRFGGDEFAIVLSQIDSPEAAKTVAKRILRCLEAPVFVDELEAKISTSIGIALAPGDASDSKGLLKAADIAMYYAKRGGDGFAFYQDHMDEPRIDQLRLKTDLREALDRGELQLHYQPQVDVRNGSIVGAEVLLRWNHPEQGLIPPLQFIPLAEEMEIINELGTWTLRESCRQLIEFDAMGVRLPRITINISSLQFNQEFIDTLRSVLDESALDPTRLQLELTEGAIITDVGGAAQILHGLKEIGVCLSIDDFGTGFSPMSYLTRFPLDELKIDRRFVIRSQENTTVANLVTGFIAMARCMNMRLVASGVETPEQFDFLVAHGAHILQGYLFSEPVSPGELKPLLAPWHFMDQLLKMTNELDDKLSPGSGHARGRTTLPGFPGERHDQR